ncbi:MAG: response regulator [Desulfobacteraceae bacterium]|nr:response regulator [Desulfobacteraceae bacterium]
MATILLIDDDDMIQVVTRELLELSGYEVRSAVSGREGLALVSDPANRIDLILLDLSLPDADGLELIPQLTAARPGVGIVVCTGSFYEHPSKLGANPAIKGILQKPFNLQALQNMVRKTLAA